MAEEWEELNAAMEARDIVEIADACADLVVTVLGTAAEYGIPFDAVWREVDRSNWAKAGPDGEVYRRADGKITKPPDWQPPDIAGVLGIGRETATGQSKGQESKNTHREESSA
jgi:predicted HAD superfamily Cof-like phosphohydrolase